MLLNGDGMDMNLKRAHEFKIRKRMGVLDLILLQVNFVDNAGLCVSFRTDLLVSHFLCLFFFRMI